jgi:hypothetical protein
MLSAFAETIVVQPSSQTGLGRGVNDRFWPSTHECLSY